MDVNPLDLALREIAETQRLLETLIVSSESFDYPKAKLALRQLQRKSRELAKLQSKLKERQMPENVQRVDFGVALRVNV